MLVWKCMLGWCVGGGEPPPSRTCGCCGGVGITPPSLWVYCCCMGVTPPRANPLLLLLLLHPMVTFY